MFYNEEAGIFEVLFVINMDKSVTGSYYMNEGAYPEEEEVLLIEGTLLEVISV